MIIKTGPATAMSLEELINAQAFLGLMSERIADNGHKVPEVTAAELVAVNRELTERLRADKERQLQNLRNRREALIPASEKRAMVESEIATLETELGYREESPKAAGSGRGTKSHASKSKRAGAAGR